LQGQRSAGINHLYCGGRQSREDPRKPEYYQSPCGKERKTGDSGISARDLEKLEIKNVNVFIIREKRKNKKWQRSES
jgi:hypothetical protein